jgi:iron complex outermembrane receptor protein
MKVPGFLLVGILIFPSLVPAQDQELELEMFFASEETVTSAARHEQEIGMSPSAVTVITREDIEAFGAVNLPDLLRLVPGMDVLMTTPEYTAVTARMNWTNEGNHLLALVDGRDVTIELAGFPYWQALPVSLEDVERIEVLRGPGSALYGANALSGVINITTRRISKTPSAWAGILVGEPGMLSLGGRASTRLGNWGFGLNARVDMPGNFIDPHHPGGHVWKVRAIAEHHLSNRKKILFEGGFSEGTGMITAAMGNLDGSLALMTLRAAYESEDLRGQFFWNMAPINARLDTPLEFRGVHLARFQSLEALGHTLDGEIQWTLPTFFEPLLFIIGGGGRFSQIGSDGFLNADTFTDITSSRYHQPGIDYSEMRAGAFVHGELSPADWVTATFGLRFDYNTITDVFLSPRLATVFRPVPGQFLRAGVARSFRKPSFIETHLHLKADFPDESPITGAGQDRFQEFMTRIIGNSELENEELISFEIGYLGQFLDARLSVAVDLYYNIYRHEVELYSHMVPDEQGLPDLDESSFMYVNQDRDMAIIGGELTIRYRPSRAVSLLASWAHREVFNREENQLIDTSPKNLITLGGRYRADWGLVSSLYAFCRSEFWDRAVQNPGGLLEPLLKEHLDNALLLVGRLGWRWKPSDFMALEVGARIYLPVSPFSSPHFRYREFGGGLATNGNYYGGHELRRIFVGYLEGSF